MVRLNMIAAVPLLLFYSASSLAAATVPPVTEEDLLGHIKILASDDFEGRKPGTAGETKTLVYLTAELARIGFKPGANDGGWLQKVPLVERRMQNQSIRFSSGGSTITISDDEMMIVGREPAVAIANAPLVDARDVPFDALLKQDLRGALVIVSADFFSGDTGERIGDLLRAGAAGLITELPTESGWNGGARWLQSNRDAARPMLPVHGIVLKQTLDRLLPMSGSSRGSADDGRVVADVRVSTDVRTFSSYNVVGRLEGAGKTGENLVYVAHWDHLGICAPEDRGDRICNGAVDNASGLAALLEIGERLAIGSRPQRDIILLATTAEESGLAGARHFIANPSVPLDRIVATINIDTIAIHPKDEPLAMIGRGHAPLDEIAAETARKLGRKMDYDKEADAFIERQDGWEFTKAGVPAIMIGGSFSSMKTLGAFLSGPYHSPDDDLKSSIILDGAAQDTNYMLELGRNLADPKIYPRSEAGIAGKPNL